MFKLKDLCGFAYECAIENMTDLKMGEIKNFKKVEEFADKFNYTFDENGKIL